MTLIYTVSTSAVVRVSPHHALNTDLDLHRGHVQLCVDDHWCVLKAGGRADLLTVAAGSVALFRDDSSCMTYAFSLWQMSLAALLSYYIGTFFNCCLLPIIQREVAKD